MSTTVDNISYSENHDKHQVNNQLPSHKFIVVLSQLNYTDWNVHGPHCLANGRSWILRAASEGSVSLQDPGCVQQQPVQPNRHSEGKHSRQHLNVCQAVAVTCHPPPKLFSLSPLAGAQNGKLPTLVSEADKHWLSNCAKIARLVNASSLVVTLMLLCV